MEFSGSFSGQVKHPLKTVTSKDRLLLKRILRIVLSKATDNFVIPVSSPKARKPAAIRLMFWLRDRCYFLMGGSHNTSIFEPCEKLQISFKCSANYDEALAEIAKKLA